MPVLEPTYSAKAEYSMTSQQTGRHSHLTTSDTQQFSVPYSIDIVLEIVDSELEQRTFSVEMQLHRCDFQPRPILVFVILVHCLLRCRLAEIRRDWTGYCIHRDLDLYHEGDYY